MTRSPDPSDPSVSSPSGRPPVDPRGAASPPPPPPGYAYPPPAYAPPKRGGMLTRLLGSLLTTVLVISIALNAYLAIIVRSLTSGPSEATYLEGETEQRLVILPVEGLIDESTYQFVRESLIELRNNPPAAVILRIDSGGGYVSPSDRIWHEIVSFKQETQVPIIASFGGTAASGGYYVAAPADLIVAEPTGITGSIGVIAQAFTVHELLDKIGVTPEIVASTASTKKDMLNPMRAWTDEDRQKLRTILDHAHEQFVRVVHEGRQHVLSEAQVRELATGEVFTADAAKQRGLVDELGYLEEAIELAAAKAGLPQGETPRVMRMRRPQGFGLMGMLKTDTPSVDVSRVTGEQVRAWLTDLSTPRMLYQ